MITIVARAEEPGTVVNHARVTQAQPDTNEANNIAHATVIISRPFIPPKSKSPTASHGAGETTVKAGASLRIPARVA